MLGEASLSSPGAGHPARLHQRLEPFLGRGAGRETQAAPGPQCSPHPTPPRPAVYVIIGIFCLSSSTGLYSCLSPLVQRLPFGRCR